jgi:hypothetical protein
MIRKVYEADPLRCPRCGGWMKVVAFITEYAVVDRIIQHLKLTFVAEKPPPAHVFEQVALMAAEEGEHYEWRVILRGNGGLSTFGCFRDRPGRLCGSDSPSAPVIAFLTLI